MLYTNVICIGTSTVKVQNLIIILGRHFVVHFLGSFFENFAYGRLVVSKYIKELYPLCILQLYASHCPFF